MGTVMAGGSAGRNLRGLAVPIAPTMNGQVGGLAQLLANVLAVYRLVSPAADEDGLLRLAG